jgi:hypothetical protein
VFLCLVKKIETKKYQITKLFFKKKTNQSIDREVMKAMDNVETKVGWCADVFHRLTSTHLASFIAAVTSAVFGNDTDTDANTTSTSISTLISPEAVATALARLDDASLTAQMQAAVHSSNLAGHVRQSLEELAGFHRRATESAKFGEMVAGGASAYFEGLTALVGRPNHLDLLGTMRKEHDDTTHFTTSNYDLTTTPKDEFALAVGELVQSPDDNNNSLPSRWTLDSEGNRVASGQRFSLSHHLQVPNLWDMSDGEWDKVGPSVIVEAIKRVSDNATHITEDHIRSIHLLRSELLALRLYTGLLID